MQAWVVLGDDQESLDTQYPAVYLDRDDAITEARRLVEHYNDSEDPEIVVEDYANDWTQFRNEAAGVYVNMFEVTIVNSERMGTYVVGEPRPAF